MAWCGLRILVVKCALLMGTIEADLTLQYSKQRFSPYSNPRDRHIGPHFMMWILRYYRGSGQWPAQYHTSMCYIIHAVSVPGTPRTSCFRIHSLTRAQSVLWENLCDTGRCLLRVMAPSGLEGYSEMAFYTDLGRKSPEVQQLSSVLK